MASQFKRGDRVRMRSWEATVEEVRHVGELVRIHVLVDGDPHRDIWGPEDCELIPPAAPEPPLPHAKVYLVENGEYEQRYMLGVFSSVEAAVSAIKARYGPEYAEVLKWSDVANLGNGCFELTARFTQRIDGLCCEGDVSYDITEYEVDARSA